MKISLLLLVIAYCGASVRAGNDDAKQVTSPAPTTMLPTPPSTPAITKPTNDVNTPSTKPGMDTTNKTNPPAPTTSTRIPTMVPTTSTPEVTKSNKRGCKGKTPGPTPSPGATTAEPWKTPIPSGTITTPTPTTNPTTPTPSSTTTPSPTSKPANSTEQFRKDMLDALNKERANGGTGLKPFCLSSKLDETAQKHAEDMAENNYMSHDSRDGTDLFARIKKLYPEANGENIAAGPSEAAQVVKMWMQDPPHRAGIMGDGALGDSTQVGVGMGTNPASQYKYYWVLDFGKSTSEPCE